MANGSAADHVQAGFEAENQGDAAAAEAHHRAADEAGSADGAFFHGLALQRRGDLAGAEAAYRRAEERGDPRASCQLGYLLEDAGDVDGAMAAYRRADAVGFAGGSYALGQALFARGDTAGALDAMRRADSLGDADGAFNLGVLLKQVGDASGAEAAFGRAAERGHVGARTAAGRLMRDRGDVDGAQRAFRAAEQAGDPDGAFEVAVALYESGDAAGAIVAFDRAAALGHAGAADIATQLRGEVATPSGPAAVPTTSNGAWEAVVEVVTRAGGRRLSAEVVTIEIDKGSTGRSQKVFVSLDGVQPAYDVVRITTPFARIDHVDLVQTVKQVGNGVLGQLGYSPLHDDAGNEANGFLTLGSCMPLALLAGADPADLLMYLASLAGAGDSLEGEHSGGDAY